MLTIARQKFFSRYLPMFLSVSLVVAALATYQILRPQTKTAEAAWYSAGGTWNYRKVLTIDHTKIASSTAETYANFPALVSITDSDLAAHASSTGADILFTTVDGQTKLNHEIESYSSSTGALIAWVNVGASGLSTTTDTSLYMYYGNASETGNEQNATGVWDTNTKGAWHLTDPTNPLSSTGVNNGTNNGATVATGKIGSAAYFNGSSDIHTGSITSTSAFTESFWFKNSSNNNGIGGWTNHRPCNIGGGTAHKLSCNNSGDSSNGVESTVSVDDNQWHYGVLTQKQKKKRIIGIEFLL